jgi:hypothetical protein
VELAAGGRSTSTVRYCRLTKGQRKEKMARGASYRAAELDSKPKPAEVDETEEPELGAQARVFEGNGELNSASWGENGVQR